MKYNLDKYKFYQKVNPSTGVVEEVIAKSTYAGKTVRGVAKCDPNDTFNLEKGKALAAARCNAKIAEKRLNRARRKMAEANEERLAADKFARNMSNYLVESTKEKSAADQYVMRLLSEM